jgi:hypothetical protein
MRRSRHGPIQQLCSKPLSAQVRRAGPRQVVGTRREDEVCTRDTQACAQAPCALFPLPLPPVARVATELSVNSALKAELRPEATRAKAQVEAARAKKTRGVEEEMEAVMRQTPAKSTQGNRDWPALYPNEARIQRNIQNETGTKGSAKEGSAPSHPPRLYFSHPLSRHFGRTQRAEANSWHEHTGSGPSVPDGSDTKVPSTEWPQRDRREGRTPVRTLRTPPGSFLQCSLFSLYLLLYSCLRLKLLIALT